MKKHEGYDLIGRYLDGDLPSEAAREFEAFLEHDRELAGEVRSEQVIRDTFDRDRAAMPTASNEPSALLLARLEASSVAAGGAIGSGTGGGLLGTIFGTVGGVTIVTAVGLIGLALGAVFFSESIETIELVDQPTPVEHPVDPDISRPSVGNPEAGENLDAGEEADDNVRENDASAGNSTPPRTITTDRITPRSSAEGFTPPPPTDQSTTTSPRKEDPVEALLERLQKDQNGEVPVTREDSVLKIRKDS